MTDKNSKRVVERKKVEIEKVTVSDISLFDLIKTKFISEMKKEFEKVNADVDPVAMIFFTGPKDKQKGKLDTLVLSHGSKSDLMKGKLSVSASNTELLKTITKVLEEIGD